MKKVCFIITSRADFSLALPVIRRFRLSKNLKIQVIISGYITKKKYGYPLEIIKKQIKKIDYIISNYPKKDDVNSISTAVSNGSAKFSSAFQKLKPNYVFVFADKYEMLSPVVALVPLSIPICHIEGGDITEGAIDDNIRHAITKLSHMHFVSTNQYKKRVIQLGEESWRIKVVGSPSLDLIKSKNLLSKKQLEKKLNVRFKDDFFLVTFHPVTHELNYTVNQIRSLLNALSKFKHKIVFTAPNADNKRDNIDSEIKKFTKKNSNSCYLKNIDYNIYLSLLKYSDAVVGNSSSGIIEASSLNTFTVNVGNRQKRREAPSSVIHCNYQTASIVKAIKQVLSLKKNKNFKFKNPYFQNNDTSNLIYNFFNKNKNKKELLKKKFNDIKVGNTK